MRISTIQNAKFAINPQSQESQHRKREFLDKFSDAMTNPQDINDCVAVPRGIFKAYLFIMSGFALIGIAGVLPAKLKNTKMVLNIFGNILNLISAVYFAKPFVVRKNSPTVRREDVNIKE